MGNYRGKDKVFQNADLHAFTGLERGQVGRRRKNICIFSTGLRKEKNTTLLSSSPVHC